jgi:predicted transcriptional regulator
MIDLIKTRMLPFEGFSTRMTLGSLEAGLMKILWERGECSVRQVFADLERPLAYTTVMTTLERLFKKGLLERRKSGRAFFYTPRLTRLEWERRRAEMLVSTFLSGPDPSRELLVSCLLDEVGKYDEPLLGELEIKIRERRKELSRREKP